MHYFSFAYLESNCEKSYYTLDEVLEKLNDSDWGSDIDDDEDVESEKEIPLIDPNEIQNEDEHTAYDNNNNNGDQNVAPTSDYDAPTTTSTDPPALAENSTAKKPGKKVKRKTQWYKKDFEPPDLTWLHDNTEIMDSISDINPIQYFLKYFPNELITLFSDETNNYTQISDGKLIGTSTNEIRKFFGVSIIMGNLKFPRIRQYWTPTTRIPIIADTMTVNRYFKLRYNLHIVSQRDPPVGETNKFWKVQPLIDSIRNACKELPFEEHNSIDEQMIPFTGRVPAKQCIKSKPNPVGVKNFVMCGKSGRAHNFELYQGKGTNLSQVHFENLGLGGSVVMKLTEILPRGEMFKVYFDNYFTSMELIRQLKLIGILSLGVARSNRMEGCELKSKNKLEKEGGRGTSDSRTTREGDITVVRWLDNGLVNLASSFVGVGNTDTVERWSASNKQKIQVPRPEAVKMYNDYMGGVDKLDFLIALYRVNAKTKKWPVRLIFHFLDFALANSWLQYRDDQRILNVPSKKIPDLLHFRQIVAETLIKAEFPKRNPGRPSLDNSDEPQQKKVSLPATRPVHDVRYDKFEHFPVHIKGLGKLCKLENCKGRSRIYCKKCDVFLCLSKDRNCFLKFHTK